MNNELYRRRTQRKATRKEVRILQELRKYVKRGSAGKQELVETSEKWLDELRVKKVILLKVMEKMKRRKNNAMFVTDEGAFYKRVNSTKEFKGDPPAIERFVEFREGIWGEEKITIKQPWMEKIKEELIKKIKDVQDTEISEETIGKIINKRENWTSPGIDGIQKFWWNKFSGTWKAIERTMKSWNEDPEGIPRWVTLGRTD